MAGLAHSLATGRAHAAAGRPGVGGAFGKVTVVSATSFVVEDRQGGNAADGTTAPITVMTTAATS